MDGFSSFASVSPPVVPVGMGAAGGGGTPAATVSGTVTSPGGLLAKIEPTRLQRFFASLTPSEAWAQVIGGFAPVSGANVFLLRITNAGVPTGVPLILAQTTTNAAGQYTLILPAGVTLSSDLVIQVTNAAAPQPIPTAGTQNAPATQATVNVNPISEEVLREVIAFLGSNPARTLADFSAAELSDLQRIINAAVAAHPSLVGATAAQTIANIQTNLAPALGSAIPILASSTNFLLILSTSLPNGTANVAYDQPILAMGNPGALSYAVTAGALPASLALNATTGQITGTPTVAGTFNFTVQVSLPAGPGVPAPVSRAFTLTIASPAPPAVASLTPPAQAIQVGLPGTLTVTLNVAQLTATTVTLAATPGGIITLPAGNQVSVLAGQTSASFTITGQAAGTTTVSVSLGASNAQATVTVSLAPPVLTIPPQTLPTGVITTSYNTTLTATGGTLPLAWTVTAGTLPDGLTLSAAGVISGMPTTAGTSNFTVQAQDSGTPVQTATRALTLIVSSFGSLTVDAFEIAGPPALFEPPTQTGQFGTFVPTAATGSLLPIDPSLLDITLGEAPVPLTQSEGMFIRYNVVTKQVFSVGYRAINSTHPDPNRRIEFRYLCQANHLFPDLVRPCSGVTVDELAKTIMFAGAVLDFEAPGFIFPLPSDIRVTGTLSCPACNIP